MTYGQRKPDIAAQRETGQKNTPAIDPVLVPDLNDRFSHSCFRLMNRAVKTAVEAASTCHQGQNECLFATGVRASREPPQPFLKPGLSTSPDIPDVLQKAVNDILRGAPKRRKEDNQRVGAPDPIRGRQEDFGRNSLLPGGKLVKSSRLAWEVAPQVDVPVPHPCADGDDRQNAQKPPKSRHAGSVRSPK